MTDKPPAMPELPEPELGYIETDKSRQPAFSARQMREALQSAQQAVPGVTGAVQTLIETLKADHPAPGVPEGFALVPVEPTPEMWQSVNQFAHAGSVWESMLAAAQAKGGQ